jgi:hypothetical protein
MKRSIFGFVFAALLSAQGAWADSYYTGYKLLEYCNPHLKLENSSAAGVCLGYITAATDTAIDWFNTTGLDSQVCVPGSVSIGKLREIVVKYLEEHPEELHKGAAGIVLNALYNAFPCEEQE